MSPKLSLSLRCADQSPLATGPDLALVQRTALDPRETEEFVATLADRGIPLVLDLDDHLLLRADDPDYERHQASLELLLAAAALVLVSTEPLRQAFSPRAHAVAVVPNLIDERLFVSGLAHTPPSAGPRGSGPIQLVYVGSPSHREDLELLRPVLDELARRWPGRFELNVVGGEPVGPGQDWYRRVTVPDANKPYPRFVAWLRRQARPGTSRWRRCARPSSTVIRAISSTSSTARWGCPPCSRIASRTPQCGRRTPVSGWMTRCRRGPPRSNGWPIDRSERDAIATAAFADVISHRLLRHGAEELLALLSPLAEPMMTR